MGCTAHYPLQNAYLQRPSLLLCECALSVQSRSYPEQILRDES